MTSWQDDVRAFMQEVKSLDLPLTPTIPQWPTVRLCINLIKEETDETILALHHFHYAPHEGQDVEHLAELADGMADSIYVLLYTANVFGIQLEPIWQEVQRTNLAKKGGGKDANGKAMKPEGWQPPDIASLIQEQMA